MYTLQKPAVDNYVRSVEVNNNLFDIAPQQQSYELLALYRSTNAIKHTYQYVT